MNTIELFCGTKSFSNIADSLGYKTFTIDNNPEFNPDFLCDILLMDGLEENYDCLWASPPCETFSVASIGYHWHKDNTPKTEAAIKGMALLEKTIQLISKSNPKYYFIENPRGKMRKVIEPMFQKYGLSPMRHTITYCQYGDTRMKPTDIWTNAPIVFKPCCKNGDKCHESAPRGSKTGTQGILTYKDRSRIPDALFLDIFSQIK